MLRLVHNLQTFATVSSDDVISQQALSKGNWREVAKRIPDHFFERIVSMLPMHVPYMTH